MMFFPDVQARGPVFSIAGGKAVLRELTGPVYRPLLQQVEKATRPFQAQCHPACRQGLPGLQECVYVLEKPRQVAEGKPAAQVLRGPSCPGRGAAHLRRALSPSRAVSQETRSPGSSIRMTALLGNSPTLGQVCRAQCQPHHNGEACPAQGQ